MILAGEEIARVGPIMTASFERVLPEILDIKQRFSESPQLEFEGAPT